MTTYLVNPYSFRKEWHFRKEKREEMDACTIINVVELNIIEPTLYYKSSFLKSGERDRRKAVYVLVCCVTKI